MRSRSMLAIVGDPLNSNDRGPLDILMALTGCLLTMSRMFQVCWLNKEVYTYVAEFWLTYLRLPKTSQFSSGYQPWQAQHNAL